MRGTGVNWEKCVRLSVAEGVLLGHALVARVADESSVRALFIKGPASVLQGLRKPRNSADVDVVVAPQDLEKIVEALQERGWRKRPVDPDMKTFPQHSITVDHPEWPCCIDVHFRFPGMEANAALCFETLWENTEPIVLAGRDIRVPSKPLAILILLLHALRSPHRPTYREEVEFLARMTDETKSAPELLELSKSTGSLAATRYFFEDLLPGALVLEWPEPSIEWRNRLVSQEPGSARIVALLQAPYAEKPRMLWRAIFPGDQTLLSWDVTADMSFRGRLLQHGSRWLRFLRSAPKLVRDIKRSRR